MKTKDEISRRRALGLSLGASLVPLFGTASVAHAGWLDDLIDVAREVSDDDKSRADSTHRSSYSAAEGIREALRIASTRTINRVGKRDGYFLDKAIHIALPERLQAAQSLMARVGLSAQLDELELRLNRAAENAAPRAKALFVDSISAMTISDAVGIVNGSDTSATQYFKRTMTPPLTNAFRPVVERELADAGAMRTFDAVVARYSDIPFVPDLDRRAKTELVDHGLKRALGGLFHYLGKEEAAIRNDPAKRTTQILKGVFGL